MVDILKKLKNGEDVLEDSKNGFFFQKEISPSEMSKERYDFIMKKREDNLAIMQKIFSYKENKKPINGDELVAFIDNIHLGNKK